LTIADLEGGGVKRFVSFALCIVAAVLASGCGPTITVENRTRFPVRAVVSQGMNREVVDPSPGESSTVDADIGPYRAYAVPDKEWIAYAKLTRKVLNDSLADADKLTGPQLLDVIQRLKDIAGRVQQYEAAAGAGNGCSGNITETGSEAHTVDVNVGANGRLVTTCR
jgi:hypothetical protein